MKINGLQIITIRAGMNQRLRGVFRNQFAVVDDADTGAEVLRLVHVMGGVQYGGSFLVELPEVVQNKGFGLHIDAYGGLIQQQELRLVQDAGDDVDAPLHAAGEGLDGFPRENGETVQVQQLMDALFQTGSGDGVHGTDDAEILHRGEFRKQGDVLRHHTDLCGDLFAFLWHFVAQDQYFSEIR